MPGVFRVGEAAIPNFGAAGGFVGFLVGELLVGGEGPPPLPTRFETPVSAVFPPASAAPAFSHTCHCGRHACPPAVPAVGLHVGCEASPPMFKNTTMRPVLLAVCGAQIAAAALVLHPQPARADSVNWDAVAACESGGNWAINTGLYDGGLQFLPSTWISNGGRDFAAFANQATREQQIVVAERLYAKSGLAPWPVCGRRG